MFRSFVRRASTVFLFVLSLCGAPAVAQQGGALVRVAVVLGNAPAATDEPTSAQTARCLKAYELYKAGAANKLVVSGGFTRDYISEARMMKIALVTFGVPADDVIEDELAATTIENGLFAARIFETRGWPKSGLLVSQQYHLPRAQGIFQKDGFDLKDSPAADAASAEAILPLLDMKADAVASAPPGDLVVVYEPYRSTEPMDWPSPGLARRLRLAAALYHRKAAQTIVLYNDRYTRGPVNLAQMMKIALVSLGVPGSSLKVAARGEYRWFGELAAAYADKSATVLTSTEAKTPPAGPAGPPPNAAPPPAGAIPSGAPPPPAAAAPPGAPGPPRSSPAITSKWKWVYVD